MASSIVYSLSSQEETIMRENGMEEDIGAENRKMKRRIGNRQEKWTKVTKIECRGEGDISVLLFGMGGVGKSALGNLLLGRDNAFSVSNQAKAETNTVTGYTGDCGNDQITVYDTPGYLARQLLEGEEVPEDAIRKGVRNIDEGIHVFILVFNASNMRNLDNEVRIIKRANLLNPRTFSHCILAVTHSATNYSSKTVDDFIKDASVSPEFKKLIKNIERRVVLVEQGSGEPLEEQISQGTPFYHAEQQAGRQMVVDLVRKTMNDNSEHGSLYPKLFIQLDLSECFPPQSTVTTPLGKKTMEELELNDEVLVVNSQGQLLYEKVIMFSHANPSHRSYFCTLSTEDGKVLQLSPGHLLHVEDIGKLVPAQDIKVGDVVFTCDTVQVHNHTGVKRSQVTATSGKWLMGIYCPHTLCGSIIVDGIAASCYTTRLQPSLAHAAMLPVRVAYHLLPEDWFRWIVPYNSEQGMPRLLWRLTQMV